MATIDFRFLVLKAARQAEWKECCEAWDACREFLIKNPIGEQTTAKYVEANRLFAEYFPEVVHLSVIPFWNLYVEEKYADTIKLRERVRKPTDD